MTVEIDEIIQGELKTNKHTILKSKVGDTQHSQKPTTIRTVIEKRHT